MLAAELIDALRHNDTSLFHKIAVQQPLYRPLVISGLELAAQGITTVQEIIRMTGEI